MNLESISNSAAFEPLALFFNPSPADSIHEARMTGPSFAPVSFECAPKSVLDDDDADPLEVDDLEDEDDDLDNDDLEDDEEDDEDEDLDEDDDLEDDDDEEDEDLDEDIDLDDEDDEDEEEEDEDDE